MLRAQSSIEFLYCTGLAVLLFAIVAVLFYQSQSDSAALSQYVESQRLCHEISSQIAAISSAGNGAQATLFRPQSLSSLNYTIFVSGPFRAMTVKYGQTGTSCGLSTSNVSNGTSSSFYIETDLPIRNTGGGVVLG